MHQNPNAQLPAITNDPARVMPAVAYVSSLRTAVSRAGQVSALNAVAEVLVKPRNPTRQQRAQIWRRVDWTTLSAPAVRAIMAQIRGAPATRNKTLCALRGVARMAWEENRISTEEYQRIKEIKGDIGLRLPKGRDVISAEIVKLLEACALDESPAGARDAALIALLASTGMRRAEACALQLAGLDTNHGSLRVIGKRNKERTVYFSGGAVEALKDWLQVRGDQVGAVFCVITKGKHVRPERPLNPVDVNRILARRADHAGVRDVTPHDFRRTYIGNFLDAGGDIVTAAALVGHENVATTQRYDRRGERAKQKAATLVNVPYKGRRR